MPNDEPSDYLVTQAIADYLASHAQLDGILYPSVQAAGAKKNIVIFHHAAGVKQLEFPPNTELDARTYTSTEDGPEADYSVSEVISEPKAQDEKKEEDDLWGLSPAAIEEAEVDTRESTLDLDLESVEVHHIDAVSFQTTSHPVRRHRWKKSDLDF